MRISTILKNIIEISEVNNIIELKIGLKIEWYETRVYYYNLKNDGALNTLSNTELHSLWIPYIIFENTDNDEAVTIQGVRNIVFVSREGNFFRSGLDSADEIYIFLGEENKLTLEQTYSKIFHCTYLLHFFPLRLSFSMEQSQME